MSKPPTRCAPATATRLVPGLKLFDIKYGWFNEEEYCEFFSRTLVARQPERTAA